MPRITNAKVTAFTIKDVDRDLANRFRAACHIKGKLYRDVLLELMDQYARENLPLKASASSGASARRESTAAAREHRSQRGMRGTVVLPRGGRTRAWTRPGRRCMRIALAARARRPSVGRSSFCERKSRDGNETAPESRAS
jgi:hypothetical protein